MAGRSDGLFSQAGDGSLRFHGATGPGSEAAERLVHTVQRRVLRHFVHPRPARRRRRHRHAHLAGRRRLQPGEVSTSERLLDCINAHIRTVEPREGSRPDSDPCRIPRATVQYSPWQVRRRRLARRLRGVLRYSCDSGRTPSAGRAEPA